jgi:hypothetical protein
MKACLLISQTDQKNAQECFLQHSKNMLDPQRKCQPDAKQALHSARSNFFDVESNLNGTEQFLFDKQHRR